MSDVGTATQGEVWTVSAYVKLGAGTTAGVSVFVRIAYYQSDGTYIGQLSLTDIVAELTGDYKRFSHTGTLPANPLISRVAAQLVVTKIANGDAFDLISDGWLLEKSDSMGSYFDGSTEDTGEWTYDWTGAAHASTSIATSAAPGLVAMASGYMTMNAAGSTTTLATPSENPAALPFRVVLPTERPCTYTVPASVPVTPLNVTLAAPAVPADFDRVATAASLLTMVTSLGASGTASSVIVTGICRLTPTFALGTCTPGTSSVATSPAPRVRTTRAPRRPQPGVSTDLMPVTITNVPMGGGVPG